MEDFVAEHRVLILKHARAFVRTQAEKVSPEDVARELEVMLLQLGTANEISASSIDSPDACLRALVPRAGGRAKRRRALINQVAAGDDLSAVSDDLSLLDADLPPVSQSPRVEAEIAHDALEAIKRALGSADALAAALLFEDDHDLSEAAQGMGASFEEMTLSRDRILAEAAARNVSPGALSRIARIAVAPRRTTPHVDEPTLAVVRGGDLGEDIIPEIDHLARCADCRARLTEGHSERRSVVVVAIEASRTGQPDLARAADQVDARLVERGSGRWTAVVSADRADTFREELEKSERNVVSRLAAATPIDVLVEDTLTIPRARLLALASPPGATGIDAAETSAWAEVARVPRKKTPGPHPAWTAFAVLAVSCAMGIAYLLATRTQ